MQADFAPSSGVTYLLKPNTQAIVRLAAGTAVTVSTLLCIPDGIGIFPAAPNFYVWALRLLGLWLSALIVWTVGFTGLLLCVRLLTRGVELNDQHLKLWRFGKPIYWSSVKAISCEQQKFFSRAFFLPTVSRLTLYTEKKTAGKTTALEPHHIPSFHFTDDEFISLFAFVSKQVYGAVPAAAEVLLSDSAARQSLKTTYEKGRIWRVVMSLIILASLVTFLGRKAALNYYFNAGNNQFRQERYQKAEKLYDLAAHVDQTFAPAWDRLARCEYRQGKESEAEEHWKKALLMKPDFVEAKIGLANIFKNRRDFKQSQKLLQSALRLSPNNIAAYMNVAEVYMEMGQPQQAEPVLLTVAKTENSKRNQANLARCYLRQKRLAPASAALATAKRLPALSVGDDAFCSLVEAELALEGGDFRQARKIADALQPQFAADASFKRLRRALEALSP